MRGWQSFKNRLFRGTCGFAALLIGISAEASPLSCKNILKGLLPVRSHEYAQGLTHTIRECFASKTMDPRTRAASQFNLAMNLLVPISSIAASHAYSVSKAEESGTKAPVYPFDLTASVFILYAWQSVIQCQNNLLPKQPEQIEESFLKTKAREMGRYAVMDVAGNAIYVAAIRTEDWIRGEEDEATLNDYIKEGGFSLIWDLGFSTAHVMMIDKILLKHMPGGRAWLTEMIKSKMFQAKVAPVNGKKVLMLKPEDWAAVPGLFLDFLIRQGYFAGRGFSFVQLRNWIMNQEDQLGEDAAAEAAEIEKALNLYLDQMYLDQIEKNKTMDRAAAIGSP